MKKLLTILLFAAFAAFAHAEPGSFCKVTLSVTIKQTRDIADVVNSNGTTTEGVKVKTTTVDNLKILTEAQKKKIIPAGALSGWEIYSKHDADSFIEFVAIKGLKMVSLSNVLSLEGFGAAESGKWVRKGSKITSGSISSEWVGGVTFNIGAKEYAAIGLFAGSETIQSANLAKVWVNNGTACKTLAGAGEAGEIVTGAIVFAKGVPVMDLSPVFL